MLIDDEEHPNMFKKTAVGEGWFRLCALSGFISEIATLI